MRINFFLLVLFSFKVATVIAQVNLGEGLVAYYPFNGDIQDKSIYGNHATSSATLNLIKDYNGRADNAAYFDGLNDYIEISNKAHINFENNENFAISLWIKPSIGQRDRSGQVNDILSKWSAMTSEAYPYAIRLYNQTNEKPGRIWVGRYESANAGCTQFQSIVSSTMVLDRHWHHVVFQKTGDQLSLYIDTKLEGTITDNAICSIQNNSNILLGQRKLNPPINDSRIYQGAVDELRIYNRDLTQKEIDILGSKKRVKIINPPGLAISPSPLSKTTLFNIENLGDAQVEEVQLFNLNGIFLGEISQNQIPGAITSGIYFLKVILKDSNSAPLIRKIVVKQ